MTALRVDKKRLVANALLASLSIGVSAVEGLVPVIAFMPPGAKIGLSNIFTMYASAEYGIADALAICLVKSLFVLATRGFTAFLMSFAGGVLSAIVCGILLRAKRKPLGYAGIGIIGAVLHNSAQTCVAALLAGSGILYYLPFLILASIVTGLVTGSILGGVFKYMKYYKNH